ncbi:MAG: aspartate-semialdehyde dehydrogenase [Deltaproteobacteria bacterium CG07_land_8_20_14_0_80_38_7]|nr:MAG: aspartate-semialdehyde dehydrogenase [Deltaproteobacteria bacterium CG07_land_8_20_14_0_80_38_7]
MKKTSYNIAVVGATGAVGQEMIKVLEQRNFPINKLLPIASEDSLGKSIIFQDKEIDITTLLQNPFESVDIALFSAGNSISKEYAPIAAGAGAIVIDNSSAFRMEDDVPLIVPEVNKHAIGKYTNRGIISNPNCSTIQLVVALNPLHKRYGIKRIVVATYQATSGAGIDAMDELSSQTIALFSNKEIKTKVFQHRIAFNLIPQIDVFLEDKDTKEEAKIVNETKKILEDDNIKVTATAVRVPVFYGHSEVVNIEFNKEVNLKDVYKILSDSEGIIVLDNPEKSEYPTPVFASGKDDVFVGRIRRDNTVQNGLNMWIVADNLRKGAALNAVQIAELLIEDYI